MTLVETYSHALATNGIAAKDQPSLQELALQIAASHTWNKSKAPEYFYTVHGLIKERTRSSPLAEAVNSWDGSLTYQELDKLSDLLTVTLRNESIEVGTVVPLCFEKTKWTIVTILAVIKIGAAFLLLDPSHPAARLDYMIKTVEANVVLCSPQHSGHEAFADLRRVIVGESTFEVANGQMRQTTHPKEDPRAALYLMFTSGTTGIPKGFTIEHRAFCSSALARASIIKRDEKSRVLQFAAFTFDPCMEDMLTTLMVGGCICIPNENERLNDLAKCIRDLDANFLNVTPGVSDLIEPEDIPGLKILLLSGESMKERHIEKWSPHLQLINGYGPSECCIKCAVNPQMIPGTKPNNIGRPVGSSLWIVNPSNLEEILPVGAEGELLIEGPTLARGYLQQNATKSFVEAPSWLKVFRNDPSARVYKTGDLAIYHEDGNIDFIGRRDTQAKINGQRIELGEIESLISKVTEQKYRAIVEVIALKEEQEPTLIAAVSHAEVSSGTRPTEGKNVTQPTPSFAQLAKVLSQELASWLPRFMIPSLFIPIRSIPLTIHGKTDRKLLRLELAELDRSLVDFSAEAVNESVDMPLSRQEEALLKVWRQAQVVKSLKGETETVAVEPFSLMEGDPEDLLEIVVEQTSLDRSAVEDVHPCTPLQSYWIEYTLSHPGEVHALWAYAVPMSIDISSLKRSWEKVVSEVPILRARAIQSSDRYLQVISKDKPICEEYASLQDFLEEKSPRNFRLGQPLTSSAIILDHASNQQYFALTSHHSAWDGWSKKIVFQRLGELYNDPESLPRTSTPLPHLLRQVQATDIDSNREFWTSQLSNVKLASFFHKPANEPAVARSYSFSVSFPATDLLLSGREFPLPGVEEIIAPTVAQIPLRISIDKQTTVATWLGDIQNRLISSIPYMHTDWDIFRTQLGDDVRQAWESSPLVVIHSVTDRQEDDDFLPLGLQQVERVFAHKIPFTVECYVSSESVKTDIFYDEMVFSPSVVKVLCGRFETVIQRILASGGNTVHSLLS
ncbi:acetyl-CoA synthetase-like protein [Myriangium duriaei CBS 260.36]|uniref:Acetyl-CoA synthetase-like protein n=1 Tax=Myriangium duriaei CBS 260.36 TaxID=1168546 RepID=A0A9P4JAI4_9PEZI|nr:acetyl-CoA synthetase-like protein [Myriangium duriaei CBS 260.36]